MQDARIDDVDKRLSHFLSELKTSYREVYLDLFVVNDAGHYYFRAVMQSVLVKRTSYLEPWLKVSLPTREIALSILNHSPANHTQLGNQS